MKRTLVRFAIALLILAASGSPSLIKEAFADGGTPFPICPNGEPWCIR